MTKKELLPADKPVKRLVRSVWNPFVNRKSLDKFYVDVVTGEIKPGWPPSNVDSTGYEPMEQLVNKFLRGEIRPDPPVYLIKTGDDIIKAMDEADISFSRGFDRADASRLALQASVMLSQMNKAKKSEAEIKKPDGATAPSAQPPAESGVKK